MIRSPCIAIATWMLLFGLSACQPKPIPMTEQEAERVQQLTAEMTPHCLGRHVVDVPKAFVLNSQSAAKVDDVTVSVTPLGRADFDLALAARRVELERTMLSGKARNIPHLRATIPLPGSQIGAVFDRTKSPSSSDRMVRTLELIAWREGFRIDARISARDTTFPEDANDSIAKQLQTNLQERLFVLLGVFERTRGLAKGEMPAETGLCIANGFVRGPATDQERAQMAFHLKGSPDVYFNFFSQTEVRDKTTMLERSAAIEREMRQSGTTTVRKGVRKINAFSYEEWLMRGPTPDRVAGTMFTLQANETERDPAKPVVEFKLFNGFRIPAPPSTPEESAQMKELTKASLTEAEALGVWDVVSATIRPREVAP